MKIVIASLAAALLIAGCQKPTSTATTQTGTATATTQAPGFTVNDLAEHDADIQGCARSLSRLHTQSAYGIFAEDGVESGAKGFIRINGALINVALVSSNETEKGGTRTFADKANTVQIVETLVAGAAHQEADSVEETGSLAITFQGAAQTIDVEGGTAC